MKSKLLLMLFVCGSLLPLRAQLLPLAGDPFWRDSIPQEMRKSYIKYGERYLGKPWKELPLDVFAEFRKTGNRSNFENISFEKRRQLAAIVMAEIIEGKGRFMGDILKGMDSFIAETWWGIPAHYPESAPKAELQEVDLFNAETASLIAWTRYMLQKQFDAASPGLCQRLDREIERRILVPAVEKNYSWKRLGSNWNPWCCSNWLTCVLICEKDEARKAEAIRQIRTATQTFIDAYPDDGGCDEGPAYWDRAAASMFEIMRLLNYGSKDKKVRNMAAYAYRTYIVNDHCVSFADSHANKTVQQVNILYPFGLWLNDQTMREFGAYLGRVKGVLTNPADLYHKSGNFPTLGRELFFLRHINDFIAEQPREPLLKDAWLPDLQIMTARRDNLYVAMKGGHNGENHNHNDVGSFIIYAPQQQDGDGEAKPLFIDPAVGEYTAQTFSKDRYKIWTMQSGYHNLPQINGVDQKDGKEYAARNVSHKKGRLRLDIAGAYPPEAAVKSWKRTVKATAEGITVTEAYKLSEYRQPTRLMLMTTNPNALQRIDFDANQLTATIEDISDKLDPLLKRMWGPQMYRIVLTVNSNQLKNKIQYTIR